MTERGAMLAEFRRLACGHFQPSDETLAFVFDCALQAAASQQPARVIGYDLANGKDCTVFGRVKNGVVHVDSVEFSNADQQPATGPRPDCPHCGGSGARFGTNPVCCRRPDEHGECCGNPEPEIVQCNCEELSGQQPSGTGNLVDEGLAYFERSGDAGDKKYVAAIRAALANQQPAAQVVADDRLRAVWKWCRQTAEDFANGNAVQRGKAAAYLSAAHHIKSKYFRGCSDKDMLAAQQPAGEGKP